MKTYDFFADPGHGWLKVAIKELENLGIVKEITAYSYKRNGWAYLEEDQDADTFIKALGYTPKFREHVARTKSSKIRSYEHFCSFDA